MKTTTHGTGELLLAAIDSGARKILIGIGGSATNDGGIGLAQALGYRLLDRAGKPVSFGGDGLLQLDAIDATFAIRASTKYRSKWRVMSPTR